MKCLILGGGGFLGSHLTEKFLDSGYEVTVFDKSDAPFSNFLIKKGAKLIKGDFFNEDDLHNALEDKDIVIHLVSTTVPKTSNENPKYDIESNLMGTVNFLDVIRKFTVKKLIFASSGGTVYGIPKDIPIKENHPTNPICSYGIVKLAIEKYIQLYNHNFNLEYSILRMSNLYGERQPISDQQGIVSTIINSGLKKKIIEIFGDGTIIRDYLYVKDASEAFLKAANNTGKHKIFNIGSGHGYSINQIIKIVETNFGIDLEINYKKSRSLDVPINILDINKAKKLLNWTPKTNLSNGLDKTINYFSEHYNFH